MKKYTRWFSPAFAMVIAFVHGLIYVFLMPPWQHYDEPSHFEYVWLVATGQMTEPPVPDLSFRRKLVQSMVEHDFYRGAALPAMETIETGTQIYGLEFSQLDESPLYYWFPALPVRFMQEFDPAVMLVGARMMSVGFLVLTILCLWGFTREITPSTSLQFWVPLSAALLPGFVDLMTAINNDVGAVMAFSAFLWACANFLNHPRKGWAVLWVLGCIGICVGMKSTSYFAAPLGGFVLLLGWIKGPFARWIWVVGISLGLIGFSTLLTWQEAAYWHRATAQILPTRVKTPSTPLGQYALQLDVSAPTTPNFIRPLQQPLSPPVTNTPLTFGVWMWHSGSMPVELRTPVLTTGKEAFYKMITVTSQPQFFSFDMVFTVPSNWFWISLSPSAQRTDLVVYYDGFVLVEGYFPIDDPPVFTDNRGGQVTWEGQPFVNLIRNPSIEIIWPAIDPKVDNQITRFVPNNTRASMWLFGLYDGEMTARYFRITVQNIIETFWGRFGWGHVPLITYSTYSVLEYLTWFSLAGGGVVWLSSKFADRSKIVFLLITLGLVWGATLFRGEIFIFTSHLFIPGARYAYPAIGPTLLALLAGWQSLGGILNKYLPITPFDLRRMAYIIGTLFFLSLDILSIYSILQYYERI